MRYAIELGALAGAGAGTGAALSEVEDAIVGDSDEDETREGAETKSGVAATPGAEAVSVATNKPVTSPNKVFLGISPLL